MSGPSGTYTFVFTDIEGSTAHLRALGDAYPDVLRAHDSIVRSVAAEHGGRAFGSEGDAQALVFAEAADAVVAAAHIQRELAAHPWPEGHTIRVRIGIHTGAAERLGDDFVGLALHETARISAAGHGGQVLVSAATWELAREPLPDDLRLRDLGEHALRDLGRPMRIYQLDIEGLDGEFPPLRSMGAARIRLPTQLTSFVGRTEVEAVARLCLEHRLVTLTGPGGTGKTRLSIAAAREVADRFDDGVVFVPLDSISDPALVVPEILTVLGSSSGSEPPVLETLVRHLAEKRMLLVIDNLEQVIEAATDIAGIVTGTTGVHVLVTSRIPLRVYGEQEFAVPALALPPAGLATTAEAEEYESMRLFVDRARAARPTFELADGDVPAVVDIVRRLDGLPLAIELAAARLRLLPVAALRDRLDDRLGTLTGGGRDRPTRQQTLRGAIAWSHDLLDEPDRRLFARFGVFAGGATLELVEAVCGPAEELGRDVFAGIDSLSTQSLLHLVDGGPDPRFAMLATIREFALERLTDGGEADALRRRHAEAHASFAERAAPELIGRGGRAWNERLEAMHDDLRAALDWSVETGAADIALRLVAALWRFWQVRGHLHEGEERAARVLAMPSVAGQPPDLVARAESGAGGIAYWRADPPSAYRHYSAALAHARVSGDERLLAQATYEFGYAPTPEAELRVDNVLQGEPYFREALERFRALGDRKGEASATWALHQVARIRGDLETSERLALETLDIAREIDDPFQSGWVAFTLGIVHIDQGRIGRAAGRLRESLDTFTASEDITGIAMNLFTIAQAGLVAGDRADAWRILGAVARMQRESGASLAEIDPAIEHMPIQRVPEAPEDVESHAAGLGLETRAAIELAREVATRVEAALGDEPGARA